MISHLSVGMSADAVEKRYRINYDATDTVLLLGSIYICTFDIVPSPDQRPLGE